MSEPIRSFKVSPFASRQLVFLAVSLTAMATVSWGQASISLSTLNGRDGLRFDGVAGTAAGSDVAGAGDVNGDGIADFIVSAAEASFSTQVAGSTYVLFGKPSSVPAFALSAVNGVNGFRIDGVNSSDVSGASASGAGDFNGDGLNDIVIGAPGQNIDYTYPGAAYIVYGSTAGYTSLNLSAINGSNGMRILGESGQDVTGDKVSGAGDVNGDGFEDVIIGSHPVIGTSNHGKCYVVFGNNSGLTSLNLSSLNGSNGFFLVSPNMDDGFGVGVSGAGDINGDGYDDVLVGANTTNSGGNGSGSTYVIFGRADWPTSSTVNVASLNGINGFRIDGQQESFSGRGVSSAGDFNGDGYSDIIIGAHNASNTAVASGSSYLLFGKADWSTNPVVSLASLSPNSGIRIDGQLINESSGFGVAAADDVNSDGYDDIIIGAPFSSAGAGNAGAAYVIYGSKSPPAVILASSLDGTNGFRLTGASASHFVGIRVASSGDVNQDGLGDFLLSARSATYGGSNSGSAYLIYGRPGPKLTYTGTTPAGNPTDRPLATRDSRVSLDFDSGSASIETVHITHSREEIKNLEPLSNIAPTIWNISTNRTAWTTCQITISYTNSEIAGISGGESSLTIYNGQTPSGPWTPLSTTRNASRNELTALTTQFGFFVIGGPTTLNTSAETPWQQYP